MLAPGSTKWPLKLCHKESSVSFAPTQIDVKVQNIIVSSFHIKNENTLTTLPDCKQFDTSDGESERNGSITVLA